MVIGSISRTPGSVKKTPRRHALAASRGSNETDARHSEAAGTRVLIYSHDTFGLGHFRRCLKIAGEIRTQSPDASVLLITGSPLAHQFPIPHGIDFVKLPAVVKTGNDEYRSRSLEMSIHDMISMRARIIQETALAFCPDVLLVDHAPLGLRGEALPALQSLRGRSTRPAMILGLRDIIDEPARIISQWQEANVYDAIDLHYDHVTVYGQADVFDTRAEYQFPSQVARKMTFSGFISGAQADSAPTRRATARKHPLVLVTVGGGEDGGQIVDAYIEMLRRHATEVTFDTVLLPGPLLSDAQVAGLRRASRGLPIRILHFVPDVVPLLAGADLVISMAGYNAVAEILAHARRALLIPREWPRLEQLIRAQRFAAMGCVDMLRNSELSERNIWKRITKLLAATADPLADMRKKTSVATDGAKNVASLLLHSLRTRQNKESQR
jgi:predicted glycosyltransferase